MAIFKFLTPEDMQEEQVAMVEKQPMLDLIAKKQENIDILTSQLESKDKQWADLRTQFQDLAQEHTVHCAKMNRAIKVFSGVATLMGAIAGYLGCYLG